MTKYTGFEASLHFRIAYSSVTLDKTVRGDSFRDLERNIQLECEQRVLGENHREAWELESYTLRAWVYDYPMDREIGHSECLGNMPGYYPMRVPQWCRDHVGEYFYIRNSKDERLEYSFEAHRCFLI